MQDDVGEGEEMQTYPWKHLDAAEARSSGCPGCRSQKLLRTSIAGLFLAAAALAVAVAALACVVLRRADGAASVLHAGQDEYRGRLESVELSLGQLGAGWDTAAELSDVRAQLGGVARQLHWYKAARERAKQRVEQLMKLSAALASSVEAAVASVGALRSEAASLSADVTASRLDPDLQRRVEVTLRRAVQEELPPALEEEARGVRALDTWLALWLAGPRAFLNETLQRGEHQAEALQRPLLAMFQDAEHLAAEGERLRGETDELSRAVEQVSTRAGEQLAELHAAVSTIMDLAEHAANVSASVSAQDDTLQDLAEQLLYVEKQLKVKTENVQTRLEIQDLEVLNVRASMNGTEQHLTSLASYLSEVVSGAADQDSVTWADLAQLSDAATLAGFDLRVMRARQILLSDRLHAEAANLSAAMSELQLLDRNKDVIAHGIAGGVRGLPGLPGEVGDTGPAGPLGEQGPNGDVGDLGVSGSAGQEGHAGLPGEEGVQGPPGPRGTPGKKGEKGDTGISGLIGPDGPKGLKGDDGPIGDLGRPGPAGVPGPRGVPGFVGPPGPAGEMGMLGQKGEVGPPGIPGLPGAPGWPGPPGDPGPAEPEYEDVPFVATYAPGSTAAAPVTMRSPGFSAMTTAMAMTTMTLVARTSDRSPSAGTEEVSAPTPAPLPVPPIPGDVN